MILVIGDGMHLAHEVAASRYLFGKDDGLSFHNKAILPKRLFKTTWDTTVYNSRANKLNKPAYSVSSFDPTVGYDPVLGGSAPYPLEPDTQERRSFFLNNLAPDSASTATAMSTGIKTDTSNVAWLPGDPKDGKIETSPEMLRRIYGMATGVVTTGPLSHATPASFFTHNTYRMNYLAIFRELVLVGRPDVVIGGGLPFKTTYADAKDLEEARLFNQWVIVERTAGVDGATSLLAGAATAIAEKKGLMGLFGGDDGNFESPRPSNSPGAPLVTRGHIENPRFTDAVQAALDVLSQDEEGFFLLAEQADIDWANHLNDFSRMVGCVFDLHEAVAAIVDYVDRPGDEMDWSNTTLVVTSDHANSYMRIETPLGPGVLPEQRGGGTNARTYPNREVTYGTTRHTSELTTVYARGNRTEILDESQPYPGLPIIDDRAIHQLTLKAAER